MFWITESATHGNGSTINSRERRGELDVWRDAFPTASLLLSPVVLKRKGNLVCLLGRRNWVLWVLVAQGVHSALCLHPVPYRASSHKEPVGSQCACD